MTNKLPLMYVNNKFYYKNTKILFKVVIKTVNDLLFHKIIKSVHFDNDYLSKENKHKILNTQLCRFNFCCSYPECKYIHFYQKYHDEIIIYTNRIKLRRTITFRKNYEKIYTLFLYKYNIQIPIEVLKRIFIFVVEDGNELLECKYGDTCRARYCRSYHKCKICNEYFTTPGSQRNHKCMVSNNLNLNLIEVNGCKWCIRHKYKYNCKNRECEGINNIYQNIYKCYCCNYKTKDLTLIIGHYNRSTNCYKYLPLKLKTRLKNKIDNT